MTRTLRGLDAIYPYHAVRFLDHLLGEWVVICLLRAPLARLARGTYKANHIEP